MEFTDRVYQVQMAFQEWRESEEEQEGQERPYAIVCLKPFFHSSTCGSHVLFCISLTKLDI